MVRKRRRSRGAKSKGGGGALGSLRGGFRSVARGATGVGSSKGQAGSGKGGSGARNIITVLLVAAVAFFLLRRFGVIHW